jgi:hypothetical protein
LTGDAGKEKTGLDGRFFYAWGLVRFAMSFPLVD